jgi:hypothetical protein
MSSRTLIVVALLLAGGWFLLQRTGDPVSSDAKARMALIKDGLDRDVGARFLCIQAGPFPHDSRDRGIGCQRCNDLEAAGLLERSAAPDSTEERPHWIYTLTAKADGVYTTDEDPVTGNRGARFCLGRARVHHIVAGQPALHAFGNMSIGVEYVLEAVDPHPLLFDPASGPLGLQVPTGNSPKLFKPMVTTIHFTADGAKYLEQDASFRYGSWMNR